MKLFGVLALVLVFFPIPSTAQVYDLGRLPQALNVQWPQAPRITREVSVATIGELREALAQSGTRVRVRADIADNVWISQSDIEVIAAPNVRLGRWVLERAVKRVHFNGGHYSGIELSPPTQWDPVEITRAEWLIEDVLIDGVRVTAGPQSNAFTVRGTRVAIVRSQANAGWYSLWVGDHAPVQPSDLIVAGNHFVSAGSEATLRIHDTHRVVVVDNILVNGGPHAESKHCLRFHGTIDMAFAARNTMLYSGFMAGIPDSGDSDQIGQLWLHENTFYMRRMSLMRAEPPFIIMAEFLGNRTYSDLHSCFLCIPRPPSWREEGTEIVPYQAPPVNLLAW